MKVVTGTSDTRTEHSSGTAKTGFAVSISIPALLAIAGIIALGWGAIYWLGAIVWGVVATFAFTLFSMMGKSMGMTRMDLLDLLGSMMVRPDSTASRSIGAVIHHMNGALLAIAWAYTVDMAGWPANWFTGLLWGMVLWLLALMMMSTIGVIHPAIRRGEQADPGPGATNFGRMTPLGSLMGHAVYGIILGLLYQSWPLS
ncbi:MAG: hypothetical protein WD266_04765 [Balneolales bacterium]